MNFKWNYRLPVLILIIIPFLLTFQSCEVEKKEAPKSMEEIQKEEGLPVTIEIVKTVSYKSEMSFFAQLTGIVEASRRSIVGGKVDKLRAKVGDRVREGQIIVEFPIDLPIVQYEQAKQGYDITKKTYDRMRALLAAGEISQANFDGAETEYLVAKRNFESQKQMIHIDSPINGILVKMNVNEGDYIGGDIPLFTVSQVHKMKAKIWVSEQELASIRKGMSAKLNFAGKEYNGKVTEISMALDRQKQAFYADIEFDNPRGELKSGITVEIKVNMDNKEDAIMIPRNLIQIRDGKSYIFIESEGKAIRREIITGSESGINVELIEGLSSGDRLINCCQSLLEDGKKVKVTSQN